MYITSPDYPSNYPNKAACEWKIVAPPKHRIVTTFEELIMESYDNCKNEYVMLLNTNADESVKTTAMDKTCGYKKPGKTIVSSGRFVILKFVTDSYLTYKGFNMTIYAQELDSGELFSYQYYSILSQFCLLLNLKYFFWICLYNTSFSSARCAMCWTFYSAYIYWLENL
jgi:hypothetical protein